MKIEIKSPLPGTFYRKANPNSPPYKEERADVAIGDVIGLVEVMKTFHEIKADVSGKAITFSIGDAEPVMAGQVIAKVEG